MTRIILALCALLGSTTAGAGVHPGVEIGGSWVWLSDDDRADGRDPTGRADYCAAITANFVLRPEWGVATGLRYSRRGNAVDYDRVTVDDGSSGQTHEATLRLRQQYLGVPLLVRYTWPRAKAPFLFGGGEIAYLLDSSMRWTVHGVGSFDEFGVTDAMGRWNMTLVAGAGITFGMGTQEIDLALRYAHGLTDTTSEETGLGWKTRELTLMIGIRVGARPPQRPSAI